MKKVFIVLLIAIFAIPAAKAQINKGAILLGGSLGFYQRKTTDEDPIFNNHTKFKQNETSFSFLPESGFFISNSFVLGIGLGYQHNKSEFNVYTDNDLDYLHEKNTNKILVNPYSEKYFKIGNNIYITLAANINLGFGKKNEKFHNNDTIEDITGNTFSLDIFITPGITYFISKNWALSGNAGKIYYSYNSTEMIKNGNDNNYNSNTNNYGVSFSFNTFSIGIRYYLRNGTKE